jgi:hypothetical protein
MHYGLFPNEKAAIAAFHGEQREASMTGRTLKKKNPRASMTTSRD